MGYFYSNTISVVHLKTEEIEITRKGATRKSENIAMVFSEWEDLLGKTLSKSIHRKPRNPEFHS